MRRCGEECLDAVVAQLCTVKSLSAESGETVEASCAVIALLDCLDRCGSAVVQSVSILSCSGAEGSDRVAALETLRGLSEARQAVIFGCLLTIPVWAYFFLVGTSLFVRYQLNPDPAIEAMRADQVFPYFILTQLPAGLSGFAVLCLLLGLFLLGGASGPYASGLCRMPQGGAVYLRVVPYASRLPYASRVAVFL